MVSVDYSADGGSTFTAYHYLRNAQNGVVKLIDGSRNTVVEYVYNTWGEQIACTGTLATSLGANQPFRYRGYVYDTETGWYYLQSRYYNPATRRFISADVLLSTGQGVLGHNAYAYCLNNPVNRVDDLGKTSSSDPYKVFLDLWNFVCEILEQILEVKTEATSDNFLVYDLLVVSAEITTTVGIGKRECENGLFITWTNAGAQTGIGLSLYYEDLIISVTTRGFGAQIEVGYGDVSYSICVDMRFDIFKGVDLQVILSCTDYGAMVNGAYSYSACSYTQNIDLLFALGLVYAITSGDLSPLQQGTWTPSPA